MNDVGYHWAPSSRRATIQAQGLRIGCRPAVNGVEDDHRNPWISLSPTASQAWTLSAGALATGGFPSEAPAWDLWEADLTGAKVQRCGGDYPELRALQPLPVDCLVWIASRRFPVAPAFERTPGGGVAREIRCHSDEMRLHSHASLLQRLFGPARAFAATRLQHTTAR